MISEISNLHNVLIWRSSPSFRHPKRRTKAHSKTCRQPTLAPENCITPDPLTVWPLRRHKRRSSSNSQPRAKQKPACSINCGTGCSRGSVIGESPSPFYGSARPTTPRWMRPSKPRISPSAVRLMASNALLLFYQTQHSHSNCLLWKATPHLPTGKVRYPRPRNGCKCISIL